METIHILTLALAAVDEPSMVVVLVSLVLRTAVRLLRQCDFDMQMRFRFWGATKATSAVPLGKDGKQKGRRGER